MTQVGCWRMSHSQIYWVCKQRQCRIVIQSKTRVGGGLKTRLEIMCKSSEDLLALFPDLLLLQLAYCHIGVREGLETRL